MARKNRDVEFDEEPESDGGEIITVSNGSKTMEVTRKAFAGVYESKGFAEVDPDDLGEESESLTPQQKAAKTRAAKTAKKDEETE